MEAPDSVDASASVDDVTAGELEEESNKVDSLEVVSSSEDMQQEMENAGQLLTRVELELACASEKLINLNLLLMRVATREDDLDAFLSEEDPTLGASVQNVLEFDLLSGILDSAVKELDNFLSTLQMDIDCARNTMALGQHMREAFREMEAKIDDCEESLKQSREQLSEIKEQSSNFQGITLTSGKRDEPVEFFGNGSLSNLNTKIKMQTAEQQRHILGMLEKSLARELDLEKKLTESKQNEELLNLRLQEELYFMEEEAEAVWERLFRAENLADILLSSSKQLLGRLQIVQFSLNGSAKREEDLRSKLQDYSAQLQTKDSSVQEHEQTIRELKEEVKLFEEKQKDRMLELQNMKDSVKASRDLHSKIQELENAIDHLKNRTSEAEKRAETAEAECKMLRESNMDLEKQLRAADVRLQHAVASEEASQEKQNMLNSMIKDMENLIDNLKSKVLKAENETESAEEKCIILSETNANLNEELTFLKGRTESLEASLRKAEETKQTTAKEISIRTKLITDLVVQLAFERERLHKQIYSLTKDKKVMENYVQKMKDNRSTESSDHKESTEQTVSFKNDISNAASTRENKDDATELSTNGSEKSSACINVAEHENVRNIDAWQLNFKYFLPVIVLIASAAAAFWLQRLSSQV